MNLDFKVTWNIFRFTVETGEHINVENENNGKYEFSLHNDLPETFYDKLSQSFPEDTPSIGMESIKSSIEDESKKRFDFKLKSSASVDSKKCEYIY